LAAAVNSTTKDDAENLLANLKAGDVFVTDKGYYLRDLLMQRYGAHHLNPTEIAGGSGAGMTKEQCARSQVIAPIRSVTERVVLLFKRFDMFDGTALHMNEWHMMDGYKDVVSMLIMKKGPLSDLLRNLQAEFASRICKWFNAGPVYDRYDTGCRPNRIAHAVVPGGWPPWSNRVCRLCSYSMGAVPCWAKLVYVGKERFTTVMYNCVVNHQRRFLYAVVVRHSGAYQIKRNGQIGKITLTCAFELFGV
jgi:hypothetical protein